MNSNIIGLIFPKFCAACLLPIIDAEKIICTSCRHQLPLALSEKNEKHLLYSKCVGIYPIYKISSLFYYETNTEVQELIHNLKYKGQKNIGVHLAEWHCNYLKNIKEFDTIDIVIPVPIHFKRFYSRGYNQVAGYAQTIASYFDCEYNTAFLKKIKNTNTQSKHTKQERFENIQGSFKVQKSDELTNKHILLVDDVITTGATILACLESFKHIEGIKISVVSIAVTKFDGL